MIMEGKKKCDYCPFEFYWYYQAAQRKGSAGILDVDTYPTGKAEVYQVIDARRDDQGYDILVKGNVYCPKCGNTNTIQV